MGILKNEYKSFLDDIEKNVKNKEDLEYVKKRFASFLDIVLDQIDYVMDYKKDEIAKLENTQNQLVSQINQMQEVIDHIEKDIYSEDGFDFEIVCPYCNYEFIIDVDENKTEDIEGEENNHGGCQGGSCHGCNGCDDQEDDM